MFTKEIELYELKEISHNASQEIVDALNDTFDEYEIDNTMRQAAFIAQCAHESAHFKAFKENLNYSTDALMKVFGKYFPNRELAEQYARKPEMIANRVYANRMGNGDENSGDGWRYRGRGFIQLTGKNNYSAMADDFSMDLDYLPDFLETVEGACRSAGWFWDKNNLNPIADTGNMVLLTKRINGGTHGLEERTKLFNLALNVLGD